MADGFPPPTPAMRLVGAGKPPSLAWYLVILPGAFAFGVIAAFLQEVGFFVAGIRIPIGALFMVATLVSLTRALNLAFRGRTAGLLWYLGWLAATILAALPTNSGDVVFLGDISALIYLIGGAVLGAAAAAWPPDLAQAGQPESEVFSMPGTNSSVGRSLSADPGEPGR